MDDKRKRYILAGVVVGSVAVGLVVLARRTPPGQWNETVLRFGRDAVDFARTRYGSNTYVLLAEKALEQFERRSAEDQQTVSPAVSEPVQSEANAI